MSTGTQINPADYDEDGGNMWDHARREYLAGVTARTVCQRWGMSLSTFWLHARVGGWRRMDQPACDVTPEPGEYHPDDDVSFADLADEAFLNVRRALGMGRASEASTWLRVYDKLADRARPGVLSALPDLAPPRLESIREPLRRVAADEANLRDLNGVSGAADIAPEELDSLDPVFSESNEAEAGP